MKFLPPLILAIAAAFAWADDAVVSSTPAPNQLRGTVLETKQVDSYTYLRIKTADGETWAAVGKADVKEGSEVTLVNTMVMTNFESRSLQRTFPTIVFGSLAGAGGATGGWHGGSGSPAVTVDLNDIQVPKASGENAYTVEEVITKAEELKDKPVVVAGKVVKYNAGIMGRNWVHLRDGTGLEAEKSNDLLVTTADTTQTGEVITVSGVVRTDQDFGSGYSYKVLIENATLQK